MIEGINGLADLLQDAAKVQRLIEQSPDGRVWAYTDTGLFFPDDWMAQAVETFNEGEQDIFDNDDVPAALNFYQAGPTYGSVNTGGVKSGGRIVELDPKKLYPFIGEEIGNYYIRQEITDQTNSNSPLLLFSNFVLLHNY